LTTFIQCSCDHRITSTTCQLCELHNWLIVTICSIHLVANQVVCTTWPRLRYKESCSRSVVLRQPLRLHEDAIYPSTKLSKIFSSPGEPVEQEKCSA
jgi:hypothetical protein